MNLTDDYINHSTLKKGRGCANCGYTGYKGRMGLYEVFVLGEEIQNLIYNKETASVIREAARKSGMRTLREDGLRKAAAGTTTLEEVLSITIGDQN